MLSFFQEDCQTARVQPGGCSVHVRGAFHRGAKSPLLLLDRNINGVVWRDNLLLWRVQRPQANELMRPHGSNPCFTWVNFELLRNFRLEETVWVGPFTCFWWKPRLPTPGHFTNYSPPAHPNPNPTPTPNPQPPIPTTPNPTTTTLPHPTPITSQITPPPPPPPPLNLLLIN